MIDTPRKICIVTATRAEYGLLQPLMGAILAHPSLTLQLIVTGAHLSERFGATHRLITDDGFCIDEKIEMALESDQPSDITRAIGKAMIGFADALERLAPDAILLLGDRYELIAAATAALMARIPILHIAGGEVTEGALDDSIRHAVSKMAWFHFTATEAYSRRLVQLGEDPARVFTVGAIGMDNVFGMTLLDRDALSARLNFDLSKPYVLVTYHPVTLGAGDPVAGIDALIGALKDRPDLKVIFTGVNADPGYSAIDARIKVFATAAPDRVFFAASLGQLGYLSAMKHSEAVVGNSSSGIIEAPALGVPTVNIGDRQRGRIASTSQIDCVETPEAILRALEKALSPSFRAKARNADTPYGKGGVSEKIVQIVARAKLGRVAAKRFHDL